MKVFWVIPSLVWLVLRVPYPHALVFVKENFMVTSSIMLTIQPPAAKGWLTFYSYRTSTVKLALQSLKDRKTPSKVGYSNIVLQMFTSLKMLASQMLLNMKTFKPVCT